MFGLRFVLYIGVAGAFAALGFDHKQSVAPFEMMVIVGLGLALTIPPLYAVQKAVALISTLTISTLTALGPFLIFGLQIIEGRVAYSPATLIGLTICFAGSILAAVGAVWATASVARDREHARPSAL